LMEAFFPDLAALAKCYCPQLYTFMLPDHVAERCPLPFLLLQPNVMLVAPLLAAGCVAGAIIGIGGYFALQSPSRIGITPRRFNAWPLAFLYFGLMNIDGFFLHCYFVADKTLFGIPVLHCLDCMFTGLCSLHLLLGSLEDSDSKNDSWSGFAAVWSRLGTLLLVLLAIAGENVHIPFALEFVYVGMVLIGTAASICLLFLPPIIDYLTGKSRQLPEWYKGLLLAALGSLFFFGAVFPDRWLCEYLGHNHFSAVVIGFWGCNLTFIGFWFYCRAKAKEYKSSEYKK